jgi:Ca2+-binding RTX toxin-like protein
MARGSSRSGGKLIRSTQKIPVSSTHIEKLEERRLLSGSITINAQGQVTVTGTTQADDITAVPDPNVAGNILFTVDTPGVGTVTESYALASITGVVVDTDPPGTNPIVNDNDYVNFSLVTFNPGVNVGVQAGHGNDTIIGAQSPNLIFGGGGNDSLVGGAGNDTISGQNGNDTILGAAGNDLLYGDSGNDLIRGGAGNDQIIGGVGQDTL